MSTTREFLIKSGLSASEADLYLVLLREGSKTASELVRLTRAKRPTVYYALKQLKERGLVHASSARGAGRYQAAPPEKILTMLELRRGEVESLMDEAKDRLNEFKKGSASSSEELPAVVFYEGEEAMKQAVMETLYCASRHIDSLAPKDNFFWQVGQAFSSRYVNERVARGITTRNLWEEHLKPDIMSRSYKGRSDVRILPKNLHGRFRTTMFLYDDKVMYISSRGAGYVLVVRSKEHHDLMKMLYDGMWAAAGHE